MTTQLQQSAEAARRANNTVEEGQWLAAGATLANILYKIYDKATVDSVLPKPGDDDFIGPVNTA